MRHSYHANGRQAQAQALTSTLGGDPAVIYTDPSQHRGQPYATIVATTRYSLLACASLKTQDFTAAEETAIALALTQPRVRKVVTDPQRAYRNYQSGWVYRAPLRVLQNHSSTYSIQLIWTPAHASMDGNEYANQQAGAFTPQYVELHAGSYPLLTYKDITYHYRLERQTLPPPHHDLSREQHTTLRLIQSGSFPHPTRLYLMYPIR